MRIEENRWQSGAITLDIVGGNIADCVPIIDNIAKVELVVFNTAKIDLAVGEIQSMELTVDLSNNELVNGSVLTGKIVVPKKTAAKKVIDESNGKELKIAKLLTKYCNVVFIDLVAASGNELEFIVPIGQSRQDIGDLKTLSVVEKAADGSMIIYLGDEADITGYSYKMR